MVTFVLKFNFSAKKGLAWNLAKIMVIPIGIFVLQLKG